MTDLQRTAGLFQDLYNGNPWLDITLTGTLGDLSAEEAASHPVNGLHSIWEITEHLAAWRENVLRRVQGAVIVTPAHNYFEPISDTSTTAWKALLIRLEATQEAWLKFLETMEPSQLDSIYPNNGHNYYMHIQGIIQHDAYHLGQIVLLKKLLRDPGAQTKTGS